MMSIEHLALEFGVNIVGYWFRTDSPTKQIKNVSHVTQNTFHFFVLVRIPSGYIGLKDCSISLSFLINISMWS